LGYFTPNQLGGNGANLTTLLALKGRHMSAMGNAHRGKQSKILALKGRNYFAKLAPLNLAGGPPLLSASITPALFSGNYGYQILKTAFRLLLCSFLLYF